MDEGFVRFNTEDEFEDGQWIGGEFYYSKRKQKRKQTKEDALLGIFNESDSDNDGLSKRQRKGGLISKEDLTRPVNFVSHGSTLPSSEAASQNQKTQNVTDRPGLGARVDFGERSGLGFSQGEGASGLGSGDYYEDQVVEEEEVFNTALGQLLKEKAQKRMEQEKKKSKPLNKTSKHGSVAEIGKFEKHTKGIGSRLLEKMGYKGGGLGSKQQGIAVPIEARLRPKGLGMGFGDFNEKEAGLPSLGDEEVEEKKKSSSGEALASAKPKEQLWKRRFAGKKKEYKTAAQVLEEKEAQGQEVSQKILDMRGAQVRVLTNLQNINAEEKDVEDDVPMPELQHNLRLIVDMAEADIQVYDRKLQHERESLSMLTVEQKRIEKELDQQTVQLESLESIVSVLDEVHTKANFAGSLTLESMADALEDLRQRFSTEFKLYNLYAVSAYYAFPLFTSFFQGWNPLLSPSHGVSSIYKWKKVLSNSSETYVVFTDVNADDSDPYTQLIQSTVFPNLRFVTNSWDVRNPEPMLRFLEAWDGLLPPFTLHCILEQLVMPKLSMAVNAWNPRVDTVPIHRWMHPWLPLLGSRMDPLYIPITTKMSSALQYWIPSDSSAFALLSPWKHVFDASLWNHLVLRCIMPKLVTCMSQFVVNPHQQVIEPFKWVMGWVGFIPTLHIVNLLEASFFEQWLLVLYQWLSASPNYEEVMQWYTGWKDLLPEELQSNERIRFLLNSALAMMRQSVEGAGILFPQIHYVDNNPSTHPYPSNEHPSAAVGAEGEGAAGGGEEREKTKKHGLNVGSMEGGSDLSLKEAVEAFAMENDVPFLIKPGRIHGGLQVYNFGSISTCIDSSNRLLFAHLEGKWTPVSLEQLLDVHRKKGGRWNS